MDDAQDMLEMWANAQRDVALPNIGGASIQRRKVWLTPTITFRAVTLPRRQSS